MRRLLTILGLALALTGVGTLQPATTSATHVTYSVDGGTTTGTTQQTGPGDGNWT